MQSRQKSVIRDYDSMSQASEGTSSFNFRRYRRSFVDDSSLIDPTVIHTSSNTSPGQFSASQTGLTLGSFHPTRQEKVYNSCASELFSLPFSVGEGDDGNSDDNNNEEGPFDKKRRCKTRRGYVEGREVEWELQQDVTQFPKTDRKTRLERRVKNINVEKSGPETRIRLWLMQFSIITISVLYFACFILLNLSYAILWYIQENRCCDDPDQTFAQVFDFAIQTSTTIGYGGYEPVGFFSNFLVTAISFSHLVLSTVYAGLLFLKFVTPTAKIEFSDILTLHNVNGLPCLVARLGNCDGRANVLNDVQAQLAYSYYLEYKDDYGNQVGFGQTETLQLTSDKRHQLDEVWTVRHVLDESSPLYGLAFDTFPGNSIKLFRLFVCATQDVTKTIVSAQTEYMVEGTYIKTTDHKTFRHYS